MRRKVEPLLCELHAHTRWSDGALTLPELVDLYGTNGFDVLAVTDHDVRRDSPWPAPDGLPYGVQAGSHADYVAEIAAQAERARRDYDLLVLPGLELTYDDSDPLQSAHAVAVGVRDFVGLDDGIEAALVRAREAGAALVAAHPYLEVPGERPPARPTQRFSRDWQELGRLVDRWELFNRRELFAWVAEQGLPAVASGDFHEPAHLFGWKTLLPCAKREDAVVDYLRSARPAFLTRIDEVPLLRAA
jgi:predicted metal-dependent phosphoesterase TrpH